ERKLTVEVAQHPLSDEALVTLLQQTRSNDQFASAIHVDHSPNTLYHPSIAVRSPRHRSIFLFVEAVYRDIDPIAGIHDFRQIIIGEDPCIDGVCDETKRSYRRLLPQVSDSGEQQFVQKHVAYL